MTLWPLEFHCNPAGANIVYRDLGSGHLQRDASAHSDQRSLCCAVRRFAGVVNQNVDVPEFSLCLSTQCNRLGTIR